MNMHKFKPTLLAAACAVIVTGCASTGTNEMLESARTEVNAAATNPDVASRAPLELRAATDALARGDRAHREREEVAEVNHQAYLAQVKARTAQDLAAARRSTSELSQIQAEVDRARLAMRTREAELARSQAAQSMASADAARAQAAAASRDASMAAQQADAARAAAADERQRAQMATADAQRASADAARASAEAARATADASSAQERIRELQAQILEVQAKETERGLLVTLGDVLFLTGRHELQPGANQRMDKLAQFLNHFPEKQLLIEGYTDSVGTDAFNKELSQRRADAVRGALMARGVDPARIQVAGYGESYPVATNATADGRTLNRRVEVVVSDDNGNLRGREMASATR